MSQFTEMSENSRQKNLKLMEYPRSILSAEDFRAKMLAQQVKELVSLIVKGTLPAPVFGESMPGLFANLNQDGLWLKTWQGYCQSLLPGFVEEDSELYSETWTKWGIVLDGHAMELPMLERRTNESECLLWHTPDCSDRRSPKSKQQGLNNQAKAYWRTPQSHNGAQGPKSKMFYEKCLKTGQSAITLVDQVKNWPTVADTFTGNLKSTQQKSGSMHSVNLSQAVNWPTPRAREGNSGSYGCASIERNADRNYLDGVVIKKEEKPGNLNADWVELLMGLPIGWTDINVAKEDIESWQGWPAAINVEQYAYEPPRVIVGQKNRAKRLKALGNGCVPQQVYLVFAAIVEVENEA